MSSRPWPAFDSPEWLSFHFERCWPWLDAALNTSPLRTHDREHVWALLESGEAQIWPTRNSVCLTEIKTYPTGIKVLFGWLAGGDLNEVKATTKALEDHARAMGCDAAAVQGRRGWLRAFTGYEDAGMTAVKRL